MHFVTISTEVFFDHPGLVPSMLHWLDTDLSLAQSNRSAAPWVVVHGHRPTYCSCDADCDASASTLRAGLEPLFYKWGVDLFIVGHEHNCDTTAPPSATRQPHARATRGGLAGQWLASWLVGREQLAGWRTGARGHD